MLNATGERGMIAFGALYKIAKDGRRLIAANYTCWECCGPVHKGSWLMVFRMYGYPAGFLVCADCVDRVRRRRSGLRIRWFAPKGAK